VILGPRTRAEMTDTILMIEDDEELSDMVREYLEPMGFEVHTRTSGETGLEALADASFDALLLDIMLPEADGFDLCRRIRADSDLPILILTARGDEATGPATAPRSCASGASRSTGGAAR